MKRIVIFASGQGSNARKIIEYFYYHESITVAAVISNRKDVPVLEMAAGFGLPTYVFSKDDFYHTDRPLVVLQELKPDVIALAGFLWLVPEALIQTYTDKILNIHPALLPKFGGKGMYGRKVHEAVMAAGEIESGITIHLINEKYDEGRILLQEKIAITSEDTAESLAQKVMDLEHFHYPRILERFLSETGIQTT